MDIKVKFFASLREQVGFADKSITFSDNLTVADVWLQCTDSQELSENILAAVNMDYVDRDHVVAAGDEVAFFPPVTGG